MSSLTAASAKIAASPVQFAGDCVSPLHNGFTPFFNITMPERAAALLTTLSIDWSLISNAIFSAGPIAAFPSGQCLSTLQGRAGAFVLPVLLRLNTIPRLHLVIAVARLLAALWLASMVAVRIINFFISFFTGFASGKLAHDRSQFVLSCLSLRPVLSFSHSTTCVHAFTVMCGAQTATYICRFVTYWVVTTAMYAFYFQSASMRAKLLLSVAACQAVEAVTCYSCYDGIDGCAGGAACPLVTGVAANTAAFLVAAGAAAVAIDCSVILPVRYLRVLSRTALECLKSVRRRPLQGTPLAIDGAHMNLNDLQTAILDGRVDRDAAIAELMVRGANAGTQIELGRCDMILKCIAANTAVAVARPSASLGAFTLALALASKVVTLSLSSNSAVGGVVVTEDAATSSTASASSVQRATVVWPKTMEQFSSVLNAWMVILHSTGLCDFLVASEFVRVVVYDTMQNHGHSFSVAHALLLIYLERVESTQGDDINISNVHSLGSMDTFMARARLLAAEKGIKPGPTSGHAGTALAFNGASSPSAEKFCFTFNLGPGTTHPATSLTADGTCRFKHCCDSWVSDKGPKGVCGSKAHGRKACDNPAKVSQPAK
jgi:hypothetical protein